MDDLACAVHPITPAGTPLTGESAAARELRAQVLGRHLVWKEAAPRRGAEMAAELLLPRPRSDRLARLDLVSKSVKISLPRASVQTVDNEGGDRLRARPPCTTAPASHSTAVADPLLLRSPA